jgi:hypothetical protein
MSSFSSKVALALRIWWLAGVAWWKMRTEPLPGLVKQWSFPDAGTGNRSPLKLRRIVDRVLILGGWRPRCIIRAMVLYRLVAETGLEPELVIGLPLESNSKDTHAWVEINGHDLGPWPGRGNHHAMARFSHEGSK